MTINTEIIDIAGLEGGRVELTSAEIGDLDARVEGSLLRPGEDGWDDAVLVWNGIVARIPALVVQPTSAPGTSSRRSVSHGSTGSCSASKAAVTTSPEPLSLNGH